MTIKQLSEAIEKAREIYPFPDDSHISIADNPNKYDGGVGLEHLHDDNVLVKIIVKISPTYY